MVKVVFIVEEKCVWVGYFFFVVGNFLSEFFFFSRCASENISLCVYTQGFHCVSALSSIIRSDIALKTI